jgi:hypothetical protein
MSRRSRFLEIKQIRKLRDEILICNNIGRLRYLINSFPFVSSYSYSSGGMRESQVTVRLCDGYEYIEYSDGIIINNCLEKMGLRLYKLWRKNFVK